MCASPPPPPPPTHTHTHTHRLQPFRVVQWAADSARVADLMCGDGVEGGLEGAREYLMRQLDVYG